MRVIKSMALTGACLILGAAIGSSSTWEYTHRANVQLEQKRSCSRLAEEHLTSLSDSDSSTSIERVDYSAVRNSCIASFTKFTTYSNGDTNEQWLVLDLLTHEALMDTSCLTSINCGNGADVKAMNEQETAFNDAIGSKKKKP
jgi:hypothetical protein